MSRVVRFLLATALLVITTGSLGKAAVGDVVLMPDRDALTGTSLVIWGNTNSLNFGVPYTVSFGDSSSAGGIVTDPSYIAENHTYAAPGVYTVTLTVGTDSDTAVIEVFDFSTLSPENQRNVGINMAIEDGLRYLYFSQNNRAVNYTSQFTSWTVGGGIYGPDLEFVNSWTSLVILALENHGHTVTDNPAQDIFQPVVQRGLNYIFDNLQQISLGLTPNGDNPCVGVPAGPDACTGLGLNGGHGMYASAVLALSVAGSGASTAVVGPGIGAANGNFVVGRTYGEILQRQANTITWGMGDSGTARGGFGYVHNHDIGDGSTAGWGVLALLDAEAAGATIPAWVRTDVNNYAGNGLNPDGSLQYQLGMTGLSNFPKTGIALQLMHFINRPPADPQAASAANLLSTFWVGGYTTDFFTGANKDHAYGMFNAFKGLKLRGIQTLPGVGRPAGPGTIPANDWHADYQDHLVATQQAASSSSGGYWDFANGWSYCGTCDLGGGVISFTAIAELILSPVALVLPANLTLSPPTATNNVVTQPTHTVTATATANNGSPVAGATVTFTVVSGPNAGTNGTGVTNGAGEATFTYTNNGTPGTDTIVATIGELESNEVEKIWIPNNVPPVCDAGGPMVMLWPPNHQLESITLTGASDPDGDELDLVATAIWQDEPLNTTGDGNTDLFDAILNPVQVRAERTGNKKVPGDGRVYYVDFTATDPDGASCTGTILVCVPHDQGNSNTCVPGGRNVQSTQ